MTAKPLTEKTTNHLYWVGMIIIGVPIMVILLFALCWGLVGPAAFFLLPMIIPGAFIGVIVAWVNDVCKTRKHNASVHANRHQEMMQLMQSRGVSRC